MCYFFGAHELKFDEAKGVCFINDKDSTLASVWNADEAYFVTEKLWKVNNDMLTSRIQWLKQQRRCVYKK